MTTFDAAAYLAEIEKVGAVAHLIFYENGHTSLMFNVANLTGDCPAFAGLTKAGAEALKEELWRQVRERPDRVHAAGTPPPGARLLKGIAVVHKSPGPD